MYHVIFVSQFDLSYFRVRRMAGALCFAKVVQKKFQGGQISFQVCNISLSNCKETKKVDINFREKFIVVNQHEIFEIIH